MTYLAPPSYVAAGWHRRRTCRTNGNSVALGIKWWRERTTLYQAGLVGAATTSAGGARRGGWLRHRRRRIGKNRASSSAARAAHIRQKSIAPVELSRLAARRYRVMGISTAAACAIMTNGGGCHRAGSANRVLRASRVKYRAPWNVRRAALQQQRVSHRAAQ